MDAQSLPVVPFGKYKGQPITNLLNDTKYLEWCKQQEWFQKFPIVYNICVNQTITTNNQSSKTPEHNKLQNLFLKRKFNIKLINKIRRLDKYIVLLDKLYDNKDYKEYFGDQKFNTNDYGLENSRITSIFETIFNWDVHIECRGPAYGDFNNDIVLNSKYYSETMEIRKLFKDIKYIDCRGDCNNGCYFTFADIHLSIYIEIKPLMGDDYPNVLRKMTTQKKLTDDEDGVYILFINEYSSSSTSKEQLIQIFGRSGIRVVFMCELFDNLPIQPKEEQPKEQQPKEQPKEEQVEQLQITYKSIEQESLKLEEDNKLLRESLLRAEEKIKQLEEEIISLKSQKQPKSIKDYFGKK